MNQPEPTIALVGIAVIIFAAWISYALSAWATRSSYKSKSTAMQFLCQAFGILVFPVALMALLSGGAKVPGIVTGICVAASIAGHLRNRKTS